jgi:hypothetical protein
MIHFGSRMVVIRLFVCSKFRTLQTTIYMHLNELMYEGHLRFGLFLQ